MRDSGDLVATLTTDKNGEAEVSNLYLGNYYVKEITPSEGYLLDEEEHDVVCDYEEDLVAEVSRSTTSAEQVIKQPCCVCINRNVDIVIVYHISEWCFDLFNAVVTDFKCFR